MKRQFLSSLSRDYINFSIIAVLTAVSIVGWLGFNTYSNLKKDREFRYGIEADNVNNSLEAIFNNSSYFAKFIAEKIASNEAGNATNQENLKQIAYLLKANKPDNANQDQLLSWTFFDWVGPDNKMYFSSKHGIFKEPKDISFRSYLQKTNTTPWKLHLSEPAVGVPSGEYIIPAGFGVTSKNNKYLGALTMGFPIDKLTKIIDSNLKSSDINYVILDKTTKKIVLKSAGNKFNDAAIGDDATDFFNNKLEFGAVEKDAGMLVQPVFYGNSNYQYYLINYNYQYVILIGDNEVVADKDFKQVMLPRIVEALLLGVFIVLLLFFFQRRIVTPLNGLAIFAGEISKGNLTAKLPKINNREAFLLAKSLLLVRRSFARENILKEKLAKAMEEVVEAHRREIKANETLEQKVQERTTELKQALNIKTEFLNNISHEVRSPIHGVTVISEELVQGWNKLPDSERFSCIEQIQKSSKRLFSLVNDILDLASLDQGRMRFRMEAGQDLNELAKNIIAEISPLSAQKNLKIILDSRTEKLAIFDPLRIGQVIHNLINNAVKFTASGNIEVTVFEQNLCYATDDSKIVTAAIACKVKDSGVGIPEAELESIFTAFTQSSRTKTRAGGTGLGLSICREIISKHHGVIYAENNADGGSSFVFIIPLQMPVELASEHAESKILPQIAVPLAQAQIKQPEILNQNLQNQDHVQQEIEPAGILIVDDESHCLTSMRMILSRHNYNVVESLGGGNAMQLLEAHQGKIKAILLDLMMPEIYGTDLLKMIKNDERFKHIPVVIQSGTSDQKEIERAMQAGAFYFLSKPYMNADFVAVVKKALAAV